MYAIVDKESSQKSIQDKIKSDIIHQIESGELKPGDVLYSTQKMSNIYNVSLVTAHKALQDLTRRKYLVRENGKGTYVADRKNPSTFTKIGVPVYLQHNPFHVHMIEAISDQALKHDINLVLGQGSREQEFIDKLVNNDISTLIRFPRNSIKESLVWKSLENNRIRTVIVNDFWLDGGPFPSVRTDELDGVRQAMEHLISLGHSEIVFFDENKIEQRVGAFNAYYQSLLLHNIPFDATRVLYMDEYKGKSGELVKDLMRQGTAVVTTYDVFAIRIIEALRNEGVQVGEEFSVTGFDGIEDAENFDLTTVEQPVNLLIERAFKMLDAYIPGAKPEKSTVKPKLKTRGSTAPPSKKRRTL